MIVESVFVCIMYPPFAIFPFLTISTYIWVVIFHSDLWATRGGLDIRLTAEVLDYSFTSAVSNSDHVERTSIIFTAVESQLGERQVWSQLIHGGFRENHLITGYSTTWSLDWQMRGRTGTFHRNVGNKQPSSWRERQSIVWKKKHIGTRLFWTLRGHAVSTLLMILVSVSSEKSEKTSQTDVLSI